MIEEKEKLGVAVVGLGYLGKFHAEKYFKACDRCKLLALVDPDISKAHENTKALGEIPVISDYHQLASMGINCASIASTTSSHFEIAKFLLENGIDVLVEKPVTVTTSQATELIRIAQSNGRILQVGHLERFNPALVTISSLLDKPLFFEARRITPFAMRGHDVDVILDLMIHDIDIITHIVKKPVINISAVGVPVVTDSIDIANVRLEFEGGTVANLTASRVALKAERSLRMFQKDVYISLDLNQKKAKLHKKIQSTENGFPQIIMQELEVIESDALQSEIIAFLESVKTRSTPLVTGEDGLRALSLIEDIKHAMSKQDMVTIQPPI